MTVSDKIRQELARLCSRAGTRTAVFSRAAPTHWDPAQAYDPRTKEPYTRDGAWNRVITELQAGCVLTAIALETPPGKTGYWFHFYDARGARIYVKLQITSGKVIGRSFHEG